MIPRSLARVVAGALLTAAVASCATDQGGLPTPRTSPLPASPITGIVLAVDSSGLDKVRGFTLRDSAGVEREFELGQLENAADFPPGHLGEHRLTAEPVEVWFRVDNGRLVAYRLADAARPTPEPSAAPP